MITTDQLTPPPYWLTQDTLCLIDVLAVNLNAEALVTLVLQQLIEGCLIPFIPLRSHFFHSLSEYFVSQVSQVLDILDNKDDK